MNSTLAAIAHVLAFPDATASLKYVHGRSVHGHGSETEREEMEREEMERDEVGEGEREGGERGKGREKKCMRAFFSRSHYWRKSSVQNPVHTKRLEKQSTRFIIGYQKSSEEARRRSYHTLSKKEHKTQRTKLVSLSKAWAQAANRQTQPVLSK